MKRLLGSLKALAALAGCLATAAAAQQGGCGERVSVARAHFASAVEAREPVDRLESLPAEAKALVFYTELLDAQGLTLHHVWSQRGRRLADVALTVESPQWRTWSRKSLDDVARAPITVRVLDETGCLLVEATLAPEGGSGTTGEAGPEPAIANGGAAPDAGEAAASSSPQAEGGPDEAGAKGASGTATGAAAPGAESRLGDAALESLYRRARQARLDGRVDAARRLLNQALAGAPADHPLRRDLLDEREFHLPLVRARRAIAEKDPDTLGRIVEQVRGYLQGHPERFRLETMLKGYERTLWKMEKSG